LRKIFSLKERPFFDPLIVHVASFKQAESLVTEWPPLADFLARMFWPGPLTLVLPKAERVNPLITSGLASVALRMPANPMTLELIKTLGEAVAAPSANKFGRTSPSTAEHVQREFPDVDLLILDGGPCDVGIESTVIEIVTQVPSSLAPEMIRILRPGGVTAEMLAEKLKKWSRPVSIERSQSQASPGHLKHHYMPAIPLVLVAEAEPQGLSSGTRAKLLALGLATKKPVELVLSDDPAQAARELYGELRRLGESSADLIYFRRLQTQERTGGLWSAIQDRLGRAASHSL
jgi:L-threonylcarbamoyladenylate synthase